MKSKFSDYREFQKLYGKYIYNSDIDKLIDKLEISVCLDIEGAIYFRGEDMLFKFYVSNIINLTYSIEVIKYKNLKYEDIYKEDRNDSIYNESCGGKILFFPREISTIYDFLKEVIRYVDIYTVKISQ